MMRMKSVLLFVAAACATMGPCRTWACGGPVGNAIAITTDGAKYTVTNMARQPVTVIFTAWGQTFQLNLAPGQSGTPFGSGFLGQPMHGYQTCYAMTQQGR
jgi:hypothetical protein